MIKSLQEEMKLCRELCSICIAHYNLLCSPLYAMRNKIERERKEEKLEEVARKCEGEKAGRGLSDHASLEVMSLSDSRDTDSD